MIISRNFNLNAYNNVDFILIHLFAYNYINILYLNRYL